MPVARLLVGMRRAQQQGLGEVPAGFGEHRMPVGLQLIGNYFDEVRLLQVAHALQQTTDWHRAVPAGI